MKSKEELYEELMAIAHELEDVLQYDETEEGKRFGEIVNKLQEFNFD